MATTVLDSRIQRGMELSERGSIAENADGSFAVPSLKSDHIYKVALIQNVWTCDCPDFFYRHIMCKHVYAVRFWMTLNHYVKEQTPEPKVFAEDAVPCDRCGSIRVMKYGK